MCVCVRARCCTWGWPLTIVCSCGGWNCRTCRALAALGEMLFYIAAQNKTGDVNPSSGLKWVMPPLYVRNVVAVLHDKDDPVLVHYAAKTIENIMIQAGSTYGHLFSAKVSRQPSSSSPSCLSCEPTGCCFFVLPVVPAGYGGAIAASRVRA